MQRIVARFAAAADFKNIGSIRFPALFFTLSSRIFTKIPSSFRLKNQGPSYACSGFEPMLAITESFAHRYTR